MHGNFCGDESRPGGIKESKADLVLVVQSRQFLRIKEAGCEGVHVRCTFIEEHDDGSIGERVTLNIHKPEGGKSC